jgi:hypothetical protein
MEPGQSIADWKGVRIYVTMTECQTAGNKLDDMRATIAQHGGESASKARMGEINLVLKGNGPFSDERRSPRVLPFDVL